MMLTLETGKLEKAFIKKFENGIGIKSLNQLTGRENTVIIRAENRSFENKSDNISMSNQPNMRHISTDKYKGTISKMSEEKMRECNEIIAKVLNQYMISKKTCDISGLHVFMEDEAHASHDIQKRSVIFVVNKDVARENGAHFTIPGALINLIHINSQENSCKFEFTADTIVKPMTLVVGEYTLHIDISFKMSPKNLTHRTVGTQTTNDYSHNTLSTSEISSITSEFNKPQHDTLLIGTHSEVDNFNNTHQAYSKEITGGEQLSEGEFARLFNPKASSKKSQSNTTKEDFVGKLLTYTKYNADLIRPQEHQSMVNVTESKSENSIKTFESHIGLSAHNFRDYSISSSILSCEHFVAIKERNIVRKENLCYNYSNQLLNRSSKSEGNQVSARSARSYARGSESKQFRLETAKEAIIKQGDSSKASKCKGINGITRRSSSYISLHEIKQQLGNVVTSLNQLNLFVQFMDNFSQKSTTEINKLNNSNNEISKIAIKNQRRQVSDKLHAQKGLNQTQSIDSLCDRCGSFYSVGKPVNQQCDQCHLTKHDYYNLEDVESHKNELNSETRTHAYNSAEKKDSIPSNKTEEVCRSESIESCINRKCLEMETLNKTHFKKEIHGIKAGNTPNISKSCTVIIHYNDKYQNCESTNTSSLMLDNNSDNISTPVKMGISKKRFLDKSDQINNTLNGAKTTKGVRSTSEEILSVIIDKKDSSNKINNLGSSFNLNKNTQRVTSWSSSFRYSTVKLLRKRKPIPFNIFSKSLPIHIKKPTQQHSECIEKTEKLRFQHITDLVKTQFHKKNGPSLSSKTLHIVPSKSKSSEYINQSYESISNIKRKNTVRSLNHISDNKRTKKTKKSASKNNEHINVDDNNNKHTSSDSVAGTKNKKWIFF